MTLNFLCRESKKGKNGLAPIEISIIIGGNRKVVTLDRRLNPSKWSQQSQKSKDKTINEYINLVRTKLYSVEMELIKRGKTVTVENVLEAYKYGFKTENKGICDLFSEHNCDYSHNADVTLTTVLKYRKTLEYLRTFIRKEFNKEDYDIANITPAFCQKFFKFLLSFNCNNTAIGKMKQFKRIMQIAIEEGYIRTNPMLGIKLKLDKVRPIALTLEEINIIRNKEIRIERLAKVRDLFIFMCYSGLAYIDTMSFTKENIVDGMIITNRKKTGVQSSIPLLDVAKDILEKYNYELPTLSNQKLNTYLAELEDICGIKKHLHCHLARHTFCSLLVNANVPLQIVSKCMGHSNTKITESVYSSFDVRNIKDTVFAVASKIS